MNLGRRLIFSIFAAVVRVAAGSVELGGGFTDHGVATPLSEHRGMVATADGDGRDVMLVWLYDHRGGYSLLMIDAETGKTEQFATPYPWAGDGPFASLLSRANKFYTHFGSHFSEFDPAKRAFTFFGKTAPQMAMSLTEADDGAVWSATYPNSGLARFDPATRELRDFGSVNKENWLQYPRSLAVDAAGWAYVGIGSASSQIVAFDPRTGAQRALLEPAQRRQAYATVQRDAAGEVLGHAGADGQWFELREGRARALPSKPTITPRRMIAGDQGLFHRDFPSGRVARVCNTVERILTTADPRTGATRTVTFAYTSEGAHVIALAAAPDGSIAGGTAFPMRMFRFRPGRDVWENWPAHGQFNTVVRQGDRFFVGGYTRGFLLEWSSDAPTARGENPRLLMEGGTTINRPHDLVAMPDGRTIVLGGTPGYGLTGGGLMIWDREVGRGALLAHTQLLPELSVMSLVALDATTVLGGTTTAGGTGGEAKAAEAELFQFDVAAKRVTWRGAVFPGAKSFTDLAPGPRGLNYGFVDRTRFFVFDPERRRVVHSEELKTKFGTVTTGQGPRAFVRDARGRTFVLFARSIARIDDATFAVELLAKSPAAITAGGDVLGGRVYFAAGSHVLSFALPE